MGIEYVGSPFEDAANEINKDAVYALQDGSRYWANEFFNDVKNLENGIDGESYANTLSFVSKYLDPEGASPLTIDSGPNPYDPLQIVFKNPQDAEKVRKLAGK